MLAYWRTSTFLVTQAVVFFTSCTDFTAQAFESKFAISAGFWPDTVTVAQITELPVEVRDAAGRAVAGLNLEWHTSDSSVIRPVPAATSANSPYSMALVGLRAGAAEVIVSADHPGLRKAEARFTLEVSDGDWPVTLSVTRVDTAALRLPPAGQEVSAALSTQWRSSDTEVLKVTPLGQYAATITAHSQGRAELTLTVLRGAEQIIEIRNSIVVSPNVMIESVAAAWPDTMVTGNSATFTVDLLDGDSLPIESQDIEWQSEDRDVLDVSNPGGNSTDVTALGTGETAVIAVFNKAGFERTSYRKQIVVLQGWDALSNGSGRSNHTCAVSTNQRTYCWGDNRSFQLGDGGALPRSKPVPVASNLKLPVVAVGHRHTCAILDGQGQPFCWGDGQDGKLGYGRIDDFPLPTLPVRPCGQGQTCSEFQDSRSLNVHFLSAADTHTCGVSLRSTGLGLDAWCWGNDHNGQMGSVGFPDTTCSFARCYLSATKPNTSFDRVSAGRVHTCAISRRDELFCWGTNDSWQLGADTRDECGWWFRPEACNATPVRVDTDLRFKSVSAGSTHTCALTTTHDAFCWGFNSRGQLGDGRDNPRESRPVAVSGGYTFDWIGSANQFTCALDFNGTAYCWGINREGQIGDSSTGDRTNRVVPHAVAGGLTFTSLTIGERHACGLTVQKVIYCWGANDLGQLGNGLSPLEEDDDSANSFVPVRIAEPVGN